jgi:peptidoglycan/LPS O-acetylase OafA/YrhL
MNIHVEDKAVNAPDGIFIQRHFPVLDGLRGIAALTVVLFHSYKGGGFVPNGVLAVDLFFLMSGFVIAHSYGDRLVSGMSKTDFILRRFIRLYPMLFIGALGGILFAVLHNKLSPATAYPLSALISSGTLSLLVLPYLEQTIGHEAFSFNPPIWSLFFEIVANIAYVMIVRRLTIPMLLAITAAGLVGVVWFGPLGGGENGFFVPGFPRVACGFFGGVLLQRLWISFPGCRRSIGFVSLTVAVLALFCIPKVIGGMLFLPTFFFMAGVIWLAVGEGAVETRPFLHFLGQVSYPIYLIHWLTLYVFAFAGKAFHLDYAVTVTAHLLVVPVVGYLLAKFYEAPARYWLSRLFGIGKEAL